MREMKGKGFEKVGSIEERKGVGGIIDINLYGEKQSENIGGSSTSWDERASRESLLCKRERNLLSPVSSNFGITSLSLSLTNKYTELANLLPFGVLQFNW